MGSVFFSVWLHQKEVQAVINREQVSTFLDFFKIALILRL